MFRKLLILGAIAALFTIATVVPASAIAVNRGPDGDAVSVIVPQFGPQGEDAGANNAHGPACGDLAFGTPDGCASHTSPAPALENAANSPSLNGPANLGAWNSVFQAMANSDGNTAICGIWATEGEAEEGFEFLACGP
jgi:hypothetical protein